MSICKIRKIKEDIFLFADMSIGFYYNSTVILTECGPIIIDVLRDKEQFDEVIEFIKNKGFDKPAAIIYTHWHSDHTSGNRQFKDCRIISHTSTIKHLEVLKKKLTEIDKMDKMPIIPNETFEDNMELSIGNKKLKLMHCKGHTFDSIMIYDDENKVLISGDNLVSSEVEFAMPPVIPPDEDDASYLDLENMFKTVENINPEIIIPGHGMMLDAKGIIALNKKRYEKCISENLKSTL